MSVAVAAIADLALREPPARTHPVVGMGALLTRAERHLPAEPREQALARGAAGLAAAGAAVGAAAILCQHGVSRLRPRWLGVVAEGAALWSLVSFRLLVDHVRAVGVALSADDVAGARSEVAAIVSRDTTSLDATGCAEAAIESLAENLNDGWVATLAWYAVAGLPGAAVHRLVDTADSRWGYRDDRWRWAGTAAARFDDVLAAVPARMTGLALVPPSKWRHLGREARRTSSPNAGWPMAAMAIRLDVRLGKPGVYELHADGRSATASDIDRAVGAAVPVAAAAAVVAALVRWRRG